MKYLRIENAGLMQKEALTQKETLEVMLKKY